MQRDPATGKYIDPRSGELIEKDPTTGDYADSSYYARRPLAWACYDYCSSAEGQDGSWSGTGDRRFVQQWDNSTGYYVRTGTASIGLSAGRDLVLLERPSVVYTAGEKAADIAGFYNPAGADYSENGGDIVIKVAGDIEAADKLPQTPAGWLARRNGLDYTTGYFAPAADRPYDQTTWYVNFGSYESGIGALGGGNIDIAAGGSIYNLAVNIPNTARVTGNTSQDDPPMVQHLTGGGDLSIRAGGDIRGGVYYVADGVAQLTAGGSFTSGASFKSNLNNGYAPNCESGGCYTPADLREVMPHRFDVYPMLYTSSGEFRLQSGGDLNIEAVMDPMLYDVWNWRSNAFMSYTPEARVSLFSAGGDVLIRNNALNFDVVEEHSGTNPLWFPGTRFGGTGTDNRFNVGLSSVYHQLWPATLSAVAAAGDVQVLGTMTLAPSPQGNFELLAGENIYIGYGTRAEDAFFQNEQPQNRSGGSGIFMSQAKVELLRTTLNPLTVDNYGLSAFQSAGASNVYGGAAGFSLLVPPDLHQGDATPVRIYAGSGDIVTTAGINLPILFGAAQQSERPDAGSRGQRPVLHRQRLHLPLWTGPPGDRDRPRLLDSQQRLGHHQQQHRAGQRPAVAPGREVGRHRHQHRLQPAAELPGLRGRLPEPGAGGGDGGVPAGRGRRRPQAAGLPLRSLLRPRQRQRLGAGLARAGDGLRQLHAQPRGPAAAADRGGADRLPGRGLECLAEAAAGRDDPL